MTNTELTAKWNTLSYSARLAVLRNKGENIRGTKLWHETLAGARMESREIELRQIWTGNEA